MEDSGERKEFPGGGMRDASLGKERPELAWTADQPYEDQMITRYGRWMARGAEKYESRNWEQFDSKAALEHAKGSLLRHTFKLLAGKTDEDHAAAVWFNVQAIELIRWKQQKEIESENAFLKADEAEYLRRCLGPKVRYWKGVASMTHYFRLAGDVFTYASESRSGQRSGHAETVYHDGVRGMEQDTWISLDEIPVSEVPEWAR